MKLGVTSFGGPVAHLGYFREELVNKRKWVTDQQYGELVAICQFLPGPASSQVGFGLGLIRGGMLGALAAWVAFTLPSTLLLVLFALGAVSLDGPLGLGLLMGLKAVAVAVVAHAVVGMARTLTPDVRRILIGIATAAVSLFIIGGYSQLIAIGIGIVAGLILCRRLTPSAGARLDFRVPRWVGYAAPALLITLLVGLPILARIVPNERATE